MDFAVVEADLGIAELLGEFRPTSFDEIASVVQAEQLVEEDLVEIDNERLHAVGAVVEFVVFLVAVFFGQFLLGRIEGDGAVIGWLVFEQEIHGEADEYSGGGDADQGDNHDAFY